MAFQSIWYFTDIPKDVVDIIERDLLQNFESGMVDSRVHANSLTSDTLNKEKRNSKNAWVPTTHWLSGFIWHYVQRANRENFLYDLSCIDGESIQYTRYNVGEYYGWHNDAGISNYYKPISVGNYDQNRIQDHLNNQIETVRKLSFVLQLSDENSYEGGNLQLIDESGKCYFAPRIRGTIILFDSRTQHRVIKVTKGVRRSLVGWVVGPRWK